MLYEDKGGGMIHIYAPESTEKLIQIATCSDCGKRTRMISFFTQWYGWNSTCIRCGRNWECGEWQPLDFIRGSRNKSITSAKKRWRLVRGMES